MVSAARSRPNHYEMLGVGPAASAEEIGRAFQRKMSLFGAHLMAEAPQISVAYETLRNPARRRNYDQSLGLHVGPEPRPWGFTLEPRRWAPLIAAPAPNLHEPHVSDARAAAVAETPRDLARPGAPKPALEATQEPLADLYERMERKRADETRERWFDWKRPAIAAGVLLVGAGLIGAFAGLSVKDNATSAAKAEPALSVALPATQMQPSAAAPAAETHATSELPPAAAAPKPRRGPPPQRPTGSRTSWAEDLAKGLSTDTKEAADTDVEQSAGGQPAGVVATSLPLSNQTIARTIDRIGYRCGKIVASEGGGAGFTVTCTSGQTYQARPVHGRYRFRRVAG